jgi:TonB family protein
MRRPSSHLVTSVLILATMFFFAVSATFAQKDTIEFKFIPKYYPEAGGSLDTTQPEAVHSPKIVFPTDPALQGKEAVVWVNAEVDRQGTVHDVQVLKSTDERFNPYAIKYAKQYKFRWPQGWPQDLKNQKTGWLAFKIKFSQQK